MSGEFQQAFGAEASAFTFIAAVDAAAGAVALGGTSAAAEQVRLRPHLSLAFTTAEVIAAVRDEQGRWQLTVGLPGLYGANSPLPLSYTEDLLALDQPTLTRGVLDVLHHRLLSLLHRALHKYRDGDIAGVLHRLTGLDQRLSAGRLSSQRLLAYAGILTGRARGADALERMVQHYFNVPCQVEACILRWTPLPDEQRTRLGQAHASLGVDSVAGDTIASRATAFRVILGPLAWDIVDGFQPHGEHLADLQALIGMINGDGLDYEVELIIDSRQAPHLPMGSARLGLDLRTAGTVAAVRRELVYRSP